MFRQAIAGTAFTTEAANRVFNNIRCDSFLSDDTFRATLRALLAPRIKESGLTNGNGSLDVTAAFLAANRSEDDTRRLSAERLFREVIQTLNQPSSALCRIAITTVNGTDAGSKVFFERAVKEFCEAAGGGFEELEAIHTFFAVKFEARCFINRDRKLCAVFVDHIDMRRLHFIQCAIPAMLPWYFEGGLKLNDEEMRLVKSFQRTTKDEYLAALNVLAEQYDFRTETIKTLLTGFEARIYQKALRSSQSELTRIDERLEQYQRELRNQIREREQKLIYIAGVQSKIQEVEQGGGDSEIMQYFLRNKSLDLQRVEDETVTWRVKTYLTNFDFELAHRAIGNPRCDAYHTGSDMTDEDKKLVLSAIFSDEPVLRIRVCAQYHLTLGYEVDADSYVDYDAGYEGYLPNPHIQRYRCLGEYAAVMASLVKEHDYIAAIQTSVASCASLSWSDGAVMSEFYRQFFDSQVVCVELPTGEVVNAKGAAKWLHENPQE